MVRSTLPQSSDGLPWAVLVIPGLLMPDGGLDGWWQALMEERSEPWGFSAEGDGGTMRGTGAARG